MSENEDNNENKLNEEKLIGSSSGADSDVHIERVTTNTLEKIKEVKKVSSIQTIFSIWNTMIGSSIVSIPYNVYHAGIIPTVIIGLLYGYICYFTCSIVVRLGGKEEEYAKVVYNYFNYGFGKRAAKVGRIMQITFNLLINTGATFIYFLIINQNLYPCICLILKIFNYELNEDDLAPHFDKFSLFYCAIIISIIIFPLTILKEMNMLVKFNSYGIYFVSFLLIFVIYNGITVLFKDTFHFEYKKNIDGSKDRNLFLFGENIGTLTGTLSIGLFCHSVILNLLKSNKIQENNQRDLFWGYLCVTLTYIIIGILGYIGFSGSEFSSDFKDNWFRFFKSDNYFIFVLRILNVIQLSSIFPILFFSVRRQLFLTFFEKYLNSRPLIITFSFILLSLCLIVLYFCYDILGNLIGLVGATTSLVLIYTISPLTNMIYYYIRHQPKEEIIKKIQRVSKSSDPEDKKEDIFPDNIKDPVPLKPVKALFFYLSMIFIMIVGIFTFTLQFVKVNFFNIKIEEN